MRDWIKTVAEKDQLNYTYDNSRPNDFMRLFEHYMAEWLSAANLNQALAYGKQFYSTSSADAERKRYLSILTGALRLSLGTSAFDQISSHFYDLAPAAAVSEQIALLAERGRFNDVMAYCLSLLATNSVNADYARLTLAGLLLDNKIDLNEKESPLELYENKHALEALHLLQGCRENVPDELIERCHAQLSPADTAHPTIKTWTDEALQLYQAYIMYKSAPNNLLSRELAHRISEQHKEDHMKGSKRTNLHLHGKFSSKHAKTSVTGADASHTRKSGLS
jgi:hypothetical protein